MLELIKKLQEIEGIEICLLFDNGSWMVKIEYVHKHIQSLVKMYSFEHPDLGHDLEKIFNKVYSEFQNVTNCGIQMKRIEAPKIEESAF